MLRILGMWRVMTRPSARAPLLGSLLAGLDDGCLNDEEIEQNKLT
jgi:hypothetical protein